MANEEGNEDFNEKVEAYDDYQGSEEYQYNYDGDDYPDYEEDYSEDQVCWKTCLLLFFNIFGCRELVDLKKMSAYGRNVIL